MQNEDEMTGLLITPGEGLADTAASRTLFLSSKVLSAVAGLDRAIVDRRDFDKAFGPGDAVRTARLNPVEVRKLCTPDLRAAKGDRRRMRVAQHQLKKDYYVPAEKLHYWVICWLGSLCAVAALGFELGVWLTK